MPLSSSEQAKVVIKPIRWRQVGAFARLKKEIEREASHLAVGSGERKETSAYVLFRMLIHQQRMTTFIALDGKTLIGFISILFPKFRKLRGNAYLTVSVKQSYQGQGIGTSLLQIAEEFARSRSARRLELEVFAKNDRAIRLYERFGYQQDGRKRKAVQDENGFDDIIFMAKLLDPISQI